MNRKNERYEKMIATPEYKANTAAERLYGSISELIDGMKDLQNKQFDAATEARAVLNDTPEHKAWMERQDES